jgi:chaperonin GroES
MGDRVVVEPISDELVTKSGIILPEQAREKPHRGRIIAMGPMVGVEAAQERERLKITHGYQPLEVGDEVLYSKYGGTELKVDLVEIVLLREADIFGRVVEGDGEEGGSVSHLQRVETHDDASHEEEPDESAVEPAPGREAAQVH